jgi:hypothetical protein
MLATTTTERVIDRVHRYTAHARPLRPPSAHLVVFVTGFHERFLRPTTARDHADRGPTIGREPTNLTARKFDNRSVAVVGQQRRAHTRCAGELAPVTSLALNVAHRHTFRNFPEWERVARRNLGSDTDLDLVPDSNTFRREHESLVTVFEFDSRDGRRTRRIVLDVHDCAAHDIALFGRSV